MYVMVSVILVQNHFVVEIVRISDAQEDRVYSFYGKVSQGFPSTVSDSDGTLTSHKTGKWLHPTYICHVGLWCYAYAPCVTWLYMVGRKVTSHLTILVFQSEPPSRVLSSSTLNSPSFLEGRWQLRTFWFSDGPSLTNDPCNDPFKEG